RGALVGGVRTGERDARGCPRGSRGVRGHGCPDGRGRFSGGAPREPWAFGSLHDGGAGATRWGGRDPGRRAGRGCRRSGGGGRKEGPVGGERETVDARRGGGARRGRGGRGRGAGGTRAPSP